MKGSLDLVGGGDDLDVVRDVERAFGIRITDEEAEATLTVGQLFDLIQAKCGSARAQVCLSQIAFYRLRRVLSPDDKAAITPQTPVAVVRKLDEHSIGRAWKELSRRSGLTLPMLEAPSRSRTLSLGVRRGIVIATGSVVGLLMGVFRSPAILGLFLAAPLLAIMVGSLFHHVYGDIPRRIQTIGDLAREAAGYSFSDVFKAHPAEGAADRWQALIAILRRISGHKPAITRDTTFFARDSAR
ncbi:MAG TPA: hypothetical protein VJL90_15505 [Pseudorhodoplanes sp.]|nr:hypothetical protein [Pseudorhodoplanes sp.]